MKKYITLRNFKRLFIVGSITFIAFILFIFFSLPSVKDLQNIELQTPLRVFTQDKQLIAIFGEKRRIPVTFEQVPKNMENAFLAAEDSRFYNHFGVDFPGLLRATKNLILTGEKTQGGSTITMQLARNFYLTSEKKIIRKVREIFLALKIESTLSKEKILELYFNKIYLGHRAYGVAAAAQIYYGKKIDQLTLAEIAMIAGLPKAPSRYNPVTNMKRAMQRRNYVLKRMLYNDFISYNDYVRAYLSIDQAKINNIEIDVNAPYVAEMVRAKMYEKYGEEAYTKGYDVFTTVKGNLQKKANESLIKSIESYDRRHGYRIPEKKIEAKFFLNSNFEYDIEEGINNSKDVLSKIRQIKNHVPAVVVNVNKKNMIVYTKLGDRLELDLSALRIKKQLIDENKTKKINNFDDVFELGHIISMQQIKSKWYISQIPIVSGAIVSIDSNSGALKALSGGYDFRISKFNRAIQAKRQPGSSFKPFIYYSALKKGYTPATLVNDSPKVFKEDSVSEAWRPQNHSGKFYGPTRLRYALAKSRNIVSVRLLDDIGIDFTIKQLKDFGFDTSKLPKDLTLALGSGAIEPIKLAEAYTYFANGGYDIDVYFIEQIKTRSGKLLFVENPRMVCGKYCDSESLDTIQFASAQTLEELTELRKTAGLPRFALKTADSRIIYQINSMLKDVVRYGTAKKALSLKRRDIAGKTGTTNDQRDSWFCGFSRNIVTTSYIGFDDFSPLGSKEFGSTAALPMWIDYMKKALRKEPVLDLEQPENIVAVRIDSKTGLLASPKTKKTITEIFRKEHVPNTFSEGSNILQKKEEEITTPELIF